MEITKMLNKETKAGFKVHDRVKIRLEDIGHGYGIVRKVVKFGNSLAYSVQTKDNNYLVGEEELQKQGPEVEFKNIRLPILNMLNSVTLESAILKVFEEGGELSQVIGKHRGLNGETVVLTENEALNRIGEELVDLLQTAVTMSKLLEDRYGINVDDFIEAHITKVINKGYLA